MLIMPVDGHPNAKCPKNMRIEAEALLQNAGYLMKWPLRSLDRRVPGYNFWIPIEKFDYSARVPTLR